MSRKITDDKVDDKFTVTQEWCLAITNTNFIYSKLQTIVEDLDGSRENAAMSTIDTKRTGILMMIETVTEKMSRVLKRKITDGAKDSNTNSMEPVMEYLDDSLKMLSNGLNELNFELILDAFWKKIENIMQDIVKTNVSIV
jgi:hypothetical protein